MEKSTSRFLNVILTTTTGMIVKEILSMVYTVRNTSNVGTKDVTQLLIITVTGLALVLNYNG